MKRYRIPATWFTSVNPSSELEVSALCYGTSSFGTSVRGHDTDRLVAIYLEAGGCFFDTAHCYAFWEEDGLGASERELGDSLRRLGCLEDVIVATKGGHPDGGEKYRRPNAYLSESVIASDLDDSLNRLGVECIDLYYLHRDDPRVPVDEIIGILNREIERGRIRYIGASNWSVQRIAAANEYATRKGLQGFVASQLQWSLAEPNWKPGPEPTTRFVTQEYANWHASVGMPIVAYSATSSGYFAGSQQSMGLYDNLTNRARRKRAQELATRLQCSPIQIALAYLMHQTPRVIPIFRTMNQAHLVEILGSVSIVLSTEQVHWLEKDNCASVIRQAVCNIT